MKPHEYDGWAREGHCYVHHSYAAVTFGEDETRICDGCIGVAVTDAGVRVAAERLVNERTLRRIHDDFHRAVSDWSPGCPHCTEEAAA